MRLSPEDMVGDQDMSQPSEVYNLMWETDSYVSNTDRKQIVCCHYGKRKDLFLQDEKIKESFLEFKI